MAEEAKSDRPQVRPSRTPAKNKVASTDGAFGEKRGRQTAVNVKVPKKPVKPPAPPPAPKK